MVSRHSGGAESRALQIRRIEIGHPHVDDGPVDLQGRHREPSRELAKIQVAARQRRGEILPTKHGGERIETSGPSRRRGRRRQNLSKRQVGRDVVGALRKIRHQLVQRLHGVDIRVSVQGPREVGLRQFAAVSAQQHFDASRPQQTDCQHLRQPVAEIHAIRERHHLREVGQKITQVRVGELEIVVLSSREPRELACDYLIGAPLDAQRVRLEWDAAIHHREHRAAVQTTGERQPDGPHPGDRTRNRPPKGLCQRVEIRCLARGPTLEQRLQLEIGALTAAIGAQVIRQDGCRTDRARRSRPTSCLRRLRRPSGSRQRRASPAGARQAQLQAQPTATTRRPGPQRCDANTRDSYQSHRWRRPGGIPPDRRAPDRTRLRGD